MQIKHLYHIVPEKRIEPDQSKRSHKKSRAYFSYSFLGTLNYLHKLIPNLLIYLYM